MKSKGGEGANFPFIPDNTLAQLTVKELNKKVSGQLDWKERGEEGCQWTYGGNLIKCTISIGYE